jgi:hypothetical protein
MGQVMRTVYEREVADATKIERHFRQGTDKIVSAGQFGKVAKVLWPLKTAAQLASIAGKDERTAARWLSGEFEPPGVIIAAVVVEITRRN